MAALQHQATRGAVEYYCSILNQNFSVLVFYILNVFVAACWGCDGGVFVYVLKRKSGHITASDVVLYTEYVTFIWSISHNQLLIYVCICVSVCAAGVVVSHSSGSFLVGSEHWEKERHDHPDRAGARVWLLNEMCVRTDILRTEVQQMEWSLVLIYLSKMDETL